MNEFDSDISQITRGESPTFASQGYNEIKPFHTSEKGAFQLFRANHFGKWIVLKALKEEYRNDPFFETILQKEFSLGYQLNHHGVVLTIDFINLPQLGNAIVIEYINGYSLRQYLNDNAPLSRNEAQRLINEICDAVSYLHDNKIIHRDLKPENIMIERNAKAVKIIDLGCADASDYNVIKGPAGTRYYAAPEQLLVNGEIDIRTDIYAIGKIIFDIAAATSGKWGKIIHIANKCCAEEPDNRYRSVSELCAKVVSSRKLSKSTIFITASLIITIVFTLYTLLIGQNNTPIQAYKTTNHDVDYKTDTVYVTPARTNQEIADSIYNAKATIISRELAGKLKAAYTTLEQAANVEEMVKVIVNLW